MKLLTITLLILLASCSKYTMLDGTYFSNQQDCFVIDGEDGAIENKQGYIKDNLHLRQTNTTLKFRAATYSPGKLLFKTHRYRYNFKVLYKTRDSFMVSPISKLAKKYYNQRDSIVFKTKYRFADQTNYFTKIIFHSSRCFGVCDELHLELDQSGNLKVTNNGNRVLDSGRNDNYFGKVSFDDMEKLRNILKYSQLKTLEWPASRKCFDAPDLTLIVYQYDKRYYFKINSPCVPIVSNETTRYLRWLFRYPTLKKVDTTFSYEK